MATNNHETEDNAIKAQGAPNVSIGGDFSGNFIIGDNNTINPPTPEQARAERNRRAMLKVVLNTWVKGVLEKSLYYETLIDLGLEERPNAVTRPWDVQVQMPDQPNRALPSGTSIVRVFDEMQGALLILGAPGAGKTTMLLELARDAIARAERDASLPISVVFNLSSWTDPKQPLAAWLVDELINKYHAPKKVAQGWVEHHELLLLLDGLDEVKAEYREACTQAINAFQQAHGLTTPLVVCSRIADYEALTTRLQLRGAVLLQPLTDRQIDAYFEYVGPELLTVRHAWEKDAELQELSRQPLMLNIMTLAYRGKAPEALADEQAGSLGGRRKKLFDAYILQMFARVGRTKDKRYTPEQTTRYLAWLGRTMIEHRQSVFLLENMRRSWLPAAQLPSHSLMVGLVAGLVIGLGTGPMAALASGPLGGLGFGLMSVLMAVLLEAQGNLVDENPTERLRWSWSKALIGLTPILGLGLLIGVVIGLVAWLRGGFPGGLMDRLGLLAFIPVFGLVVAVLSGLEAAGIETKTVPNQGIQRSLRSWLVGGLAVGLVVGLPVGLALGPIGGLAAGLMPGVMLGLGYYGGSAVINHYCIRFFLYRNEHIPRNYEHFLNYAVDHLFLRQVGGSYVFIHRLLMEHFAALVPDLASPKNT